MYTKEDRKELDRKRGLIREAMQRCYLKKYDGRPLIEAYQNICKVLRTIGGRPETPIYCAPSSWTDPSSWERSSENPNPIIGVDDKFNIIRAKKNISGRIIKENHVPMKPRSAQIEQESSINPAVETPKTTVSSYYRISISWTDAPKLKKESVDKLRLIFKELGLEQESENYCSVDYQFKGTYEEYTLLKRVAMATLDALAGTQEFNITIYGRKI